MFRAFARVGLLLVSIVLVGCASRPLPKFEKPLARARVQTVRTTAYTHSESDHLKYGRSTALGTTLRAGSVRSAAADWSRWPAGTTFRILETGEVYQVDDYGWALAGTNTIDLYKTSRSAMNQWGVRRVTIENLAWGDVDRSLAILRKRQKHRHVKRMVEQIEKRYADLKRPLELQPVSLVRAEISPAAEIGPAAAAPAEPLRTAGNVPLVPFHGGVVR